MTETATKETRKPGAGPPKRNRNALRHGMKAGKLPKGCEYVEIRLNTFRRTLEDAVVLAKGEVSLMDAAAINTAVKWERHSMLAQRWLRLKAEELSPADLLRFSEALAKGSTNRDKALATLNLDRDSSDDIIDALYSRGKNGPATVTE